MLFAKDILRPKIAGAAAMGESRVTARERTPADRDHCGLHKIVIIAAGAIRPISFTARFWKLRTVSENRYRGSTSASLNSPREIFDPGAGRSNHCVCKQGRARGELGRGFTPRDRS